MIRRPPSSPLFPYTPLSRSASNAVTASTTFNEEFINNTACATTTYHFRNTTGLVSSSATNLGVASITMTAAGSGYTSVRSEEHTSELQSQSNLVCRLLLEKK